MTKRRPERLPSRLPSRCGGSVHVPVVSGTCTVAKRGDCSRWWAILLLIIYFHETDSLYDLVSYENSDSTSRTRTISSELSTEISFAIVNPYLR
jgi:hypothetical protein